LEKLLNSRTLNGFGIFDRRGIATDEWQQMQHQSSPRHALSDVLSASHMVTTSQPIMGGGVGGIGGAGGGISIGGAELKPRFYDEVSGPPTIQRPH